MTAALRSAASRVGAALDVSRTGAEVGCHGTGGTTSSRNGDTNAFDATDGASSGIGAC